MESSTKRFRMIQQNSYPIQQILLKNWFVQLKLRLNLINSKTFLISRLQNHTNNPLDGLSNSARSKKKDCDPEASRYKRTDTDYEYLPVNGFRIFEISWILRE